MRWRSSDHVAEIFVMSSNGDSVRRLTPGSDPEWSPDGRKIAFVRGDDQIYVINADGTGPTRLAEGESPTWQPVPSGIPALNSHRT